MKPWKPRKRLRYLSRSQDERCEMDITLSDGSGAQCQRYRIPGSKYCKQHTQIVHKLEPRR